jgi:hypothetical protein
MPPALQNLPSAKVIGSVIGATIIGIILLIVLPFLLFGLYIFFRGVWLVMFKDRAQYLLDEKTRAAWNAEARREARLRYNSMALLRDWARKNGILEEGSPLELSVLVCGL